MKRFVTYLYAYRDGQKMKNTGHIRVDVRGQMLDMRISIKDAELDNEKGIFFIVVKQETINTIRVEELCMKNGEYNGRLVCDSNEQDKCTFQLEDIIGVCVCYRNECYMASCWKDGEEDIIAQGRFLESAKTKDMIEETIENIAEGILQNIAENTEEDMVENAKEDITEDAIKDIAEERMKQDDNNSISDVPMIAAAISQEEIGAESSFEENKAEIEPELGVGTGYEAEPCCRKINLSEIYTLPSNYWHFSNNSFLLHGFWNYGYLVVKENAVENKKRIVLGVPGVFEQPEMVMAAYFGFPEFETLPSQMAEMEIGQSCSCMGEKKDQPPKAGTFGCWFTNL